MHPPLQCAACCAGALVLRDGAWTCERCDAVARTEAAVFVGLAAGPSAPPAPLEPGDLAPALAALDAGTAYRAALETLLLALPEDRSERLQQLLREGRGALGVLLRTAGGTALLAGNALSGTAVALARLGFAVTAADASLERLRFAHHRDEALAPGRVRAVHAPAGDRLPFADGAFDLVVREAPFAGEAVPELDECARVARGELVVTADNRLGYKQSSGKRGDFRVLSPLALARRALFGDGRTLHGWRRALAADGASVRAYALYPHSRDFTHVAALDEPGPRLYVGPKESENRAKVAAYRAGLFSVFLPSFAVVRASEGLGQRRLERVLAALARELDEPLPAPDALVSTRGNNALVMTSVGGEPVRGAWIVRIPLNPMQAELVAKEHAMLHRLRERHPRVPVPEPLFLGDVEGLRLSCERRLPGHSAAQFSGRVEAMQRLYAEAAGHLAELVVERATLDEARFARLIDERHELVAAHAEPASTRAALAAMRDLARERLLGRELPLVLRHSDLRSKHVQIDADGRVLGYYDWGSAEDADLPLYDLLHLLVHERKQETGGAAGAAWNLARDGGAGLRPAERAALDGYCAAVGLDPEARRVLEEIYPLLVGAMAEKNWDYSRPRWLHRGFGI